MLFCGISLSGNGLLSIAASNDLSRFSTDNNSTIVGHELTKNWKELLTWLNAVKICCRIPNVIFPAIIVGISIRYEKILSACRYKLLATLKYI